MKYKRQSIASSEICVHTGDPLKSYEYTWTLTVDGTEAFEVTDIQLNYCYMDGQNIIYDIGLHGRIDTMGVGGSFTYKLVENSVPLLELN